MKSVVRTPVARCRCLLATVYSAVVLALSANSASAQPPPSAPHHAPPAQLGLGATSDSGFAFTERSRLFGAGAQKAEKVDAPAPRSFLNVVPESSTLAMMALGLAAITVARQRRSPRRTPPSKRRPVERDEQE